MLRDNVSTFSFLCIIAAYSSAYASDSKSYLEELEDAFAAKIEQSHKRSNHATLENDSLDSSEDEDENNEIGRNVAIDIKESFKEAKSFFALGQWSSWEKTKVRFEKAEKALNNFKTKYLSQLANASSTKKEAKEEEEEDDDENEEVTTPPTSITSSPVVQSSVPGMTTKPVSPSMPSTPTPSTPGMIARPNTAAFPIMQKPAAPVVQNTQAPTMPGMTSQPVSTAPKAPSNQTPIMPGMNTSAPTMPGMTSQSVSAMPQTSSSTAPMMPGMTPKPAVGPGGMPLA